MMVRFYHAFLMLEDPKQDVVPILAAAGVDCKVDIFAYLDGQFRLLVSLQGHEDWVRSLAFTTPDPGQADLMLASCSQDRYIRLWKLSLVSSSAESSTSFSKGLVWQSYIGSVFVLTPYGSVSGTMEFGSRRYAKNVDMLGLQLVAALDALLIGHEEWVNSVRWFPYSVASDGKDYHQPMCLLSSSMDKSMILWRPDPQTGIWLNSARVGEMGGSSFGFLGGLFGPGGRSILSHGYQGGFYLWKQDVGGNGGFRRRAYLKSILV